MEANSIQNKGSLDPALVKKVFDEFFIPPQRKPVRKDNTKSKTTDESFTAERFFIDYFFPVDFPEETIPRAPKKQVGDYPDFSVDALGEWHPSVTKNSRPGSGITDSFFCMF